MVRRLNLYMKLRCAVLCAIGLLSLQGADPALTGVRNVYLLPMSGGLDQYLANKLTASRNFQVVTDPAHADAILSDQVGEGFEERLAELYPPPPPPDKPADEKKQTAPYDFMEPRSRQCLPGGPGVQTCALVHVPAATEHPS
jgi:hypothetical protein